MLCDLQVLLKFLFVRVLALMGGQCGFEYGQLLVCLEAPEAFGCFHHAGGRPSQRHGGVAPSFHVATDAAHRTHHVLDGVGAGERAPELGGKPKPIDGQHLVQPFEDAGGDARRFLLEPASEIAQQALGLGGIIELPGLSQRLAHRGVQRLRQPLDHIAGLVDPAYGGRRSIGSPWIKPSRRRR